MNNKIKIFGNIIIAFFMICLVLSSLNSVHALTLKEMENQASNFINTGKSNSGNIDTANLTKEFSDLGQILTLIGAGVMVAITAYMGIKYLTAGPEAQAKLKGQLIGVLVSGIVIFGAYYIWKIIITIARSF